ncbi:MAG: hypothetical protein IRZ16_24040, partial [Myxococcaceae bacterium]|nr:hypothetical protein [Myxococcaceae bacterium]
RGERDSRDGDWRDGRDIGDDDGRGTNDHSDGHGRIRDHLSDQRDGHWSVFFGERIRS